MKRVFALDRSDVRGIAGARNWCAGGAMALITVLFSVTLAQSREPPVEPPIELPADSDFETRRTDHFLIWYDTSYDALRPLVNRVEGTYGAVVRVGRAHGFAMEESAEPLLVVFAEAHDDYAELANRVNVDGRGSAGFYDPIENVSIFGNIVNSPSLQPMVREIDRLSGRIQRSRQQGRRGGSSSVRTWARELNRLSVQRDAIVKRFNRVVIQHEAAHHIFFNVGVHRRGADNPLWLVEGLATQFEIAQTDAGGRLERINHMRLGDLRQAAGIAPSVGALTKGSYATAFGPKGLLTLAELVGDEWQLTISADRATTVYAQSWALVFYLAREHADAFSNYLRRVAERPIGVSVESAEEIAQFSAAFGRLDERFQRAWLDYIVSLRFDPNED